MHLFRGPVGGLKKIQSNVFKHLLNLVLGKVKKVEGPSYNGTQSIAKMLRGGGSPRPPFIEDMVNRMLNLYHDKFQKYTNG